MKIECVYVIIFKNNPYYMLLSQVSTVLRALILCAFIHAWIFMRQKKKIKWLF